MDQFLSTLSAFFSPMLTWAESALEAVKVFITHNAAWAGVILGAVTFVESLLVIGAFVPATGLLIAAGSLAATGTLDLANVVIGCVIGAVLGDAVSYWVGRKMGSRVLHHRILRRHRRKVAWTRLYCSRYGVAAIFVGRFFGPLRAFVPVTVGVLGMRHLKFEIANVTSAIVWVVAMVAPGWLVAKGMAHFLDSRGMVIGGVALVVIVGAVLGLQRWLKGRAAARNQLLKGAVE